MGWWSPSRGAGWACGAEEEGGGGIGDRNRN